MSIGHLPPPPHLLDAHRPPCVHRHHLACAATDGLSSILRKIPASSEANSIFEGLKRQYVAAGYPHRRTWAFQPDDDSQESAYNELRARGYIEQLTMAMYILSTAGQQEIMQSDGR